MADEEEPHLLCGVRPRRLAASLLYECSDGARSDAASSFAQMKDQAKLLRSAGLDGASRVRAREAGHRIN